MTVLVLQVAILLLQVIALIQHGQLKKLVQALVRTRLRLKGGFFMFIVKDTQPDVNYKITPPTVVDAEGSPVDAGTLTYNVASDNPSAVAITPSSTDPMAGSISIGSPNPDGSPAIANLTVGVSNAAGTLLGSFGAQFTVVAGDAASITGGGISFEGLTES